MRIFFLTLLAVMTISLRAQSPDLSLLLKMDSFYNDNPRFKIQMKICKPNKMTTRGDWFSHDTSSIDFTSLKINDIIYGESFAKGTPTLISGKEEKPPYNQFEFSGQVFAWEEIYVFRISGWSSRGWHPEMYIVLPVKYKSFGTTINLTGIEFQSGKVLFLTDVNAAYTEGRLLIQQSLKDKKVVEVKDFPQKEIAGKN
jgi:hypothetical protein